MTFAPPIPDLGRLSDAAEDTPIVALWTQLDVALAASGANSDGIFVLMPAPLHRGEPLR